MPRTMHLLDSSGHVTVTWEQQNDDKLLPVIDSMLARGYKFFIVHSGSNNEGVQIDDEVEITSAQEALVARRVRISDEMLQQLHDSGFLHVGGFSLTEDEDAITGEVATDAQTVMENETVATQPKSGG